MKCCIDLDGVVANFVEGCCKLFDRDPSIWPRGEYAFPFAALGAESEDAVWNIIADCQDDFWRNLKPMHDAQIIVQLCEDKFGKENCCFLTSPPKSSPYAATGKIQWVKKHFQDYNRRILVGACKEFCAHSGSVLIDDYKFNIDKFNKHGGTGILLPRPWNEEWRLPPIETLMERLKTI